MIKNESNWNQTWTCAAIMSMKKYGTNNDRLNEQTNINNQNNSDQNNPDQSNQDIQDKLDEEAIFKEDFSQLNYVKIISYKFGGEK